MTTPETSSTQRAAFITKQIVRIDGSAPDAMINKHNKMADNPFAFFRGSAQLFYADLNAGNITVPSSFASLPLTCVTGDCHLSNFGFITEEGSHGDNVIFAPNDFDDACVGNACWDIIRYLCSLALARDYCQGIASGDYLHPKNTSDKPAISQSDVTKAMSLFLEQYIATCHALHTGLLHRDAAVESVPEGARLHKAFCKAKRRSALGEEFVTKSALAKAVYMADEGLQFIHNTDKFSPLAAHHYKEIASAFAPYMDDEIIDIVVRNNAGTGSVNLERFYFLVGPAKPHDERSFSRCHIVEVKQQREAAPLYYFPDLCPVNRLNPAHLTARCQRRMQRRPDLLLDEAIWQNKHYLVRSRHHARVSIKPEDIGLGKKNLAGGFDDFVVLCGKALALAHARGDRRSTRFEERAVSLFTQESQALIDCATHYANQVITDHAWFVNALLKA